MPGPPPKPKDQRQGHRTRLEIVPTDAPPTQLAPAPPAHLLKATREEWASFWASDLARLVGPTDLPALERLFTLRDTRDRLMETARDQGHMVEGYKGQPVLNPAMRHALAIDAEVRQLEDRFGLNLQARLRLGITFGEAARSLADVNALAGHDDDDDEPDPRFPAVQLPADDG